MYIQVVYGYGELGFDSGEGAWEMATTSKVKKAKKCLISLF